MQNSDTSGGDRLQRGEVRDIGVLVVDDDDAFRATLAELVEATPGFAVAGAANSGEQALVLAGRDHPDLVLLDVRLPGLGGAGTAARLATLTPRPLVVFMSGDEASAVATEPAAYGAVAFETKRGLRPSTLRRLWETHGGG